jgi:uncharacterized protein
MPHPALPALLILQDRDQTRRGLEVQLAGVPRDVAAVEAKISSERQAIETAKAELRELETKRKGLEGDIRSAEEKLAKYRTQQAAVRKNDEFKALGHEIETVEAQISELEGQELVVMFAIDEARSRYAAAEAQHQQAIAGHEARRQTLQERAASLRAEVGEAQATWETAKAHVPEPARRLYERISARQMPAVVPLRGGKCGGCHLKVSGEIDAQARKGEELVTCDQCGRIVWWDVG